MWSQQNQPTINNVFDYSTETVCLAVAAVFVRIQNDCHKDINKVHNWTGRLVTHPYRDRTKLF